MLPTGLQNVQFFEVTKLSRWQRGQLQVVIVEFLEDTGGRLRVLNSKGELRREVKGVDLLAVEKMSSSESKEGPMAVMKYLRPSTKADVTVVADHSQTYVFDSEELRDAFVGAIVRMNPRMNVQNRSRGVSQVIILYFTVYII